MVGTRAGFLFSLDSAALLFGMCCSKDKTFIFISKSESLSEVILELTTSPHS